MEYNQFKKFNNIGGWLIFAIAMMTYVSTMEPTASLWDCGEFIASSQKLQVVHPPGAPTFLMVGRMFSLLALGNPEMVAWSLNLMSALCSAFSILFLFWIITHLGRRMLTKDGGVGLSMADGIAVLGAGAIGALSCTFADSVWFSATEAEVYSMSLLCTATIFWAMLKWEERADEPYADRWLLFIAFIIGCSIFVHWLNLLSIPALTYIYYFKRYKPTPLGMFAAFGASILLLGFIYKIVIVTFVDIAASMEIFFVNSLNLPFNSGLIIFLVAFFGILISGLRYSYEQNQPLLHNALLGFMFILIGYSTITTVVIRANADPNIDMNNPEDIVSLSSYLNREQYGSRPFLTGYYYTANVVGVNKLGKRYQKGAKKYDVVGEKIDYKYKGKKIIFPRMWDTTPANKKRYEQWVGLNAGEAPSYADNIYFFLRYQIGHMYVRYFMWNFVGRQNDEQGVGQAKDGNWLSGIDFLDSMRLGPQDSLPAHVKNHASRNTFYFLPLLLGLLGLIFHAGNDRKRAFVVALLFFFSGIAIIIQGNSPPIEPRERDYIFAGSFYAFTIWLGIGVLALYDMLRTKLDGKMAAIIPIVASLLLVPTLMAQQGWDDHDRSGRYAARDFAANYLNSCAPNSIIFTQGDNDTYPLWYAQEVEGIRRDVRVVNLSLLGVDWYINQLRRKVNDAAAVPMSLSRSAVRGSKRDLVPIIENPRIAPEGQFVSLQEIMKFVASDNQTTKVPQRDDTDYIPTRNVKFAVDLNKIKARGAVAKGDEGLLEPELRWKLPKKSFYKNDLMVLDIINANNWERPIYFAISVAPSAYLGLQKYFQLEGLAYRLMPIPKQDRSPFDGRVNHEIMYDNLMTKFKFGNIKDPSVHVDTDLRRMVTNFRSNFARLAERLIEVGDKTKAAAVLNHSMTEMPQNAALFDMYMYNTISAFYDSGDFENANKITEQVATNLIEDLKYIRTLPPNMAKSYQQDKSLKEGFINQFVKTARENGQTEFADKLQGMLQ